MSDSSLRITEIFYSLQGEARSAGIPTCFVRLTGCPLRCTYCDSEYAFYGGEKFSLKAILDQVETTKARYVCVTGGEPLAQPNCLLLLSMLCDKGYSVSLETSGAMDTTNVDARVSVVLDLKTPASGEMSKNLYENIGRLKRTDQVKFVICDRADYEWARMQVDVYQLQDKVDDILFSPSYQQLSPTDLADWIIADHLCVRFQTQLHKTLWGDKPGV